MTERATASAPAGNRSCADVYEPVLTNGSGLRDSSARLKRTFSLVRESRGRRFVVMLATYRTSFAQIDASATASAKTWITPSLVPSFLAWRVLRIRTT